jgi:mycothione reductase
MTDSFDLIIIGSGSGNAIPESLYDWKIALVERGTFGGTCLNVGCIPSKMFVLPADVAETAKHGQRLGVHTSFDGVDWPAIRDRVFNRIDPIAEGGREYRATGTPNVELIQGTARFTGDKVLDVDGRTITAPLVIVAAGSRPTMPPISGLSTVRFHTSDSIMRLDALPPRVGIIGGGFIAAEMGHVFSGFGCDVTVFNRSQVLLRAQDSEISARFTEVFGKRATLCLGHIPEKVEQIGDTIVVTSKGDRYEFDELLVASGREPNTDLIDAGAGGLETHHNGRLMVDDYMATNIEGVYALGDIANDWQLKHVANAEAKIVFGNLADPENRKRMDYSAVPSAVFSDPQVASVGLTEEQATAAGRSYRVGRRDFAGTAYGWALEDQTSFAKVLVDNDTDLILGAHIIGPQSATLLQPLIQAMQFRQTATDLAEQVFYIHPALSEVVENALLDAAD